MKHTNEAEAREAFMTAVYRIPAHHVARALNTFTPGINWSGSSQNSMADRYADAHYGRIPIYPRLKSLDLALLARRALARAEGVPFWMNIKLEHEHENH